jgi:uroporphyrinogen III methyltransferase/synthase
MRAEVARAGTVYLVGAGPGDPGLLTVRGRALLDDCDAIVYDALANPRMICGTRAPGRTPYELHFVGKRGGADGSTPQAEITATLIRLARAGKSVVRLKGGDPLVFGRGSEEAQALSGAHIPFEIVPGVTAGIAAPAYAGIPVTHRGVATSVTFVTGHEDPGKDEPQTDWAALARAGGTIVLYMGVRRLPDIVRALVAAGLPDDTPVAAIQWGTYPHQRTVVATVGTIATAAQEGGITSPVITVIGRVVALREEIRWFDRPDFRPLLGRGILVTRASAQPGTLGDRLRDLGANVVDVPTTRVELLDPAPLEAALRRTPDYGHIIFTSQTAVAVVWDAVRRLGRDARLFAGVTVSAVGPATADALLARGIAVDVTPSRFVAEGVLEAIERRGDVRGSAVLYPVADGARDVLPTGLRALGASVDVVPIYRSLPDPDGADALRAALSAGAIDLVTLTSASSVHGYVEAAGPTLARRAGAVTIGPITSDAARRAGLDVLAEAAPSTIAGLVAAVIGVAPAAAVR